MIGNSDTPICIVMVGVPYSGKTTFIEEHPWLAKLPQVSLDKELLALAHGDYSSWDLYITEASHRCEKWQNKLISNHQSFVIDKTNLSHTLRCKLIERLRQNGYRVAAIVLDPPDNQTLQRRIIERKNQVVPQDIQQNMKKLYEADKHWLPIEFDAVLYVSRSGEID